MEALLVNILNRSISAGVLILVVIVLRLLLWKAPKGIICFLWAIVAVRLLCPLTLQSPFSAYRVMRPPVTETGKMEYVQVVGESEKTLAVTAPLMTAPAKEPENRVPVPVVDAGHTERVQPQQGRMKISWLAAIWEIGMLLCLGYALLSAARLKLRLRTAVCLRENIRLSDAVETPFIFGMFSPKIYLNAATPEEQIAFIVAHENAHLKRKDHLWKPLGYLLLCIYWFHPLCWIAYILFCRDIEFACDERVIRDKDFSWKKQYSLALVDCSMQRRMVFAYPLAFGEIGVKERVKNILHYKKPGFWIMLAAMVVTALVLAGFLTDPKEGGLDPSDTPVSEEDPGMSDGPGMPVSEEDPGMPDGSGTPVSEENPATPDADENTEYDPELEALKARWYETRDYPVKLYGYPDADYEERNKEWMGYFKEYGYSVMMDLCNPPADLLETFSSKELAELMMRYPDLDYMERFVPDAGGFPQAFSMIEEYSTIFYELTCREDGYTCLLEAYRDNPVDPELLRGFLFSVENRGYGEMFGCQFINLYSPQFTESEYDLACEIVKEKREWYTELWGERLTYPGFLFNLQEIEPPQQWAEAGPERANYMIRLAEERRKEWEIEEEKREKRRAETQRKYEEAMEKLLDPYRKQDEQDD